MSTILILPEAAALDQALTELVCAAGNISRVKALRKARYHLGCGVTIVPTSTGFLLPSGTRANVVHEVSFMGDCSCEAGQADRGCWHTAAIDLVELAQRYTRPRCVPLTQRPEYELALADMNELFY